MFAPGRHMRRRAELSVQMDLVDQYGFIHRTRCYFAMEDRVSDVIDDTWRPTLWHPSEVGYGDQRLNWNIRPRGLRWADSEKAPWSDPTMKDLFGDASLADDETYYLVVSQLNLRDTLHARRQIGDSVWYLGDLYRDANGGLANMRRSVNQERPRRLDTYFHYSSLLRALQQ